MSDQIGEPVILKVAGRAFTGWQSIKITTSLEAVATSFEVSVSERWYLGASSEQVPDGTQPIAGGDPCQLLIGETLVCTGQIEKVSRSYDGKSHQISVSGRSRTGSLVEAVVDANPQIRGKRVEAVAQELCQPFGITVVAEADTGAPLEEFHANPGESISAQIQRMFSVRPLLVSDSPEGDLVITSVSAARPFGAIRAGDAAIQSSSAVVDVTNIPSSVTCTGEQPLGGSGLRDGAASALSKSTITNPDVKLHRPFSIQMKGRASSEDCQKRAEEEMRRRKGASMQVSCTVQGWRDGNGKLWWKNQKRRFVDPLLGLDEEFVLKTVSFAIDAGGTTAVLQLTRPDTYIQGQPAKEQPKKDGGLQDKGGPKKEEDAT